MIIHWKLNVLSQQCTLYRSGERGDIRRKRQVSLHWAAKDGEKSQQGGKRGDQFLVAPSGVNRGEEGEISFWLPQAEFFTVSDAGFEPSTTASAVFDRYQWCDKFGVTQLIFTLSSMTAGDCCRGCVRKMLIEIILNKIFLMTTVNISDLACHVYFFLWTNGALARVLSPALLTSWGWRGCSAQLCLPPQVGAGAQPSSAYLLRLDRKDSSATR